MKRRDEPSSATASAVLDERNESPAHFDVQKIRAQFPVLTRKIHGKPLVYFDNAATTQKPKSVIDAIERYYKHENANIHRGVHTLSQEATAAYEQAREKIARFINAPHGRQIIFTRGTTEGINLVASSYGRKFLKSGDEIILSAMEHHSNIVPWQLIAEQVGAKIRVIPMNDRGELLMDEFDRLLSDKTKIVSPKSSSEPTPAARSSLSTALNGSPTAPSMSRRSTPISTPSPPTKSTAPQASAYSTEKKSC
jgi:selenocysteine lyase/cysteine desulfurase